MKNNRLVVIGGDAAGMAAASKVRRMQPDREIVVFERTDYSSYSACGMPYLIAGLVEKADNLIVRSPERFREKLSIDMQMQHEVVAIDRDKQRVEVVDRNNGTSRYEPYDQLLVATGARPFCPDIKGELADGIFGLSTLASGIKIQKFLTDNRPQKAVIVGGGYIGLEMAEALVRQKLDVSLVQRGEQVMETLDPDMGKLVSEALEEIGVKLYRKEELRGFETNEKQVTAVVTDRRTLPADIVILGMGTRPNSGLAKDAGLELTIKDAIKVDEQMNTSCDNIWAAGDCAASRHRLTEEEVHISLGTIANKQGLVAGTNIGGGSAIFPGVIGTAVSKICSIEVARTGLQEKELDRLGWKYVSATIEAKTRAGYFPGAGPITVKLLAEKRSGRLFGGQIVGDCCSAKRIDTVATALTAGMSVEDLIGLDLGYAPPFSPVWDPVQTAARALFKKI